MLLPHVVCPYDCTLYSNDLSYSEYKSSEVLNKVGYSMSLSHFSNPFSQVPLMWDSPLYAVTVLLPLVTE